MKCGFPPDPDLPQSSMSYDDDDLEESRHLERARSPNVTVGKEKSQNASIR